MLSLFTHRLISVEDVRNYLRHITDILIFDFFLTFSIICQTPDSNISKISQDVGRRYNGIREASEIECESITSWSDKSLIHTLHTSFFCEKLSLYTSKTLLVENPLS